MAPLTILKILKGILVNLYYDNILKILVKFQNLESTYFCPSNEWSNIVVFNGLVIISILLI